MKKTVCLFGIFGVMAGLAYGTGEPVAGSDNFNDGIRNKALWKKVAGTDVALVETNKRLYYDNFGTLFYREASWIWKTPYTLFNGDVLETSILINLPAITQFGTSDQIFLGMGWADGYLASAKKFRVSVRDYNAERLVIVDYFGGGLVPGATFFPFPHNVSRYYLIMRYNTVTGKVAIWQRAPDSSWTSKVGTVNLNSWWEIPLGTSLTLAPYIYGSAGEVAVSLADKVYIDNFAVNQILP